MNGNTLRSILLAALIALVGTPPATACPSCQEAVPNSSGLDEFDQTREAGAYNAVIYWMVPTPYLMLGVVAYGLYRAGRSAQDDGTSANENDVSASATGLA